MKMNFCRETFWTKAEWISVLKISTLWRCLNLRKNAISELESDRPAMNLTSLEKILLGRKYSISSWVGDGYTAILKSRNIITDEEMQSIGNLDSFKLMRMIHRQTRTGLYSDHTVLADSVKSEFRAELQSIAAAEKAYVIQGAHSNLNVEYFICNSADFEVCEIGRALRNFCLRSQCAFQADLRLSQKIYVIVSTYICKLHIFR